MKKKKSFKLVTSGLLCSILLLSSNIPTLANENADNGPVIQEAVYYVDGVEHKVPDDQLQSFIEGDPKLKLPFIDSADDSKNTITPFANACVAGDVFSGKRTSAGFQLGRKGEPVINKTKDSMTETSTMSSGHTYSGSLSGSGKFNIKVVEATAGFTIGASFNWQTSQATTITVRRGDWGWMNYGYIQETWQGEYYTRTTSCGKTNARTLTAKGAREKAKMGYTEKYPY